MCDRIVWQNDERQSGGMENCFVKRVYNATAQAVAGFCKACTVCTLKVQCERGEDSCAVGQCWFFTGATERCWEGGMRFLGRLL